MDYLTEQQVSSQTLQSSDTNTGLLTSNGDDSVISIRSTNCVVAYIQTLIRENPIFSTAPVVVSTSSTAIDLLSEPLRVTGVYDYDTYKGICVYMMSNFPEEEFPLCYTDTGDGLVGIPFNQVDQDKIPEALDNNIKLSYKHKETLDIPRRVISYFLGAVISSNSDIDTIYKLQKELLPASEIKQEDLGNYATLIDTVKDLQREASLTNPSIKVTGYYDPWTASYFHKKYSL